MKNAFTLIELMVVVSIISLLISLLLPALATARSQARMAVCMSNVRQITLANTGYAVENAGFYVPAAKDMVAANLHRWHGVRDTLNDPFDPSRGPLVDYLADGKVKQCPESVKFVQDRTWEVNFEQGSGGYGYNLTYLGSKMSQPGILIAARYENSTNMGKLARPAETLMFTDCAMAQLRNGRANYIEYSFAEPRYFLLDGAIAEQFTPSPSIHFRHHRKTNVGWADGHVDSRYMADYNSANMVYGLINYTDMALGWFEPLDNSLFDLR